MAESRVSFLNLPRSAASAIATQKLVFANMQKVGRAKTRVYNLRVHHLGLIVLGFIIMGFIIILGYSFLWADAQSDMQTVGRAKTGDRPTACTDLVRVCLTVLA